MRELLLSIYIPSADRPKDLKRLVESILNTNKLDNVNYEIVIADNSRHSDYSAVTSKLQAHNIRVIRNQVHFDTAEENLFKNWHFCKGKYVWILGDDDPIIWNSVPRLLTEMKKNKKEIIIFNSNLISNNGQLVNFNRITLLKNQKIKDYRDFAKKYGLLYAASGFSTTIVKNEFFDSANGIQWFSKFSSKIYTHVTYLMSIDIPDSTIFIDEPLVNYRRNKSDELKRSKHWINHSKRNNYYYRFPWLTGLNEQFDELELQGHIDKDYRYNVWEQNHFKDRFLLTDLQMNLYFEQLLLAKRVNSQKILKDEQKILNAYFMRNYSFLGEFLHEIDSLYLEFFEYSNKSKMQKIFLTFKIRKIRFRLFKNIQLAQNVLENKDVKMHDFYDVSALSPTEVNKLKGPRKFSLINRKNIYLRYIKYLIRRFRVFDFLSWFLKS